MFEAFCWTEFFMGIAAAALVWVAWWFGWTKSRSED